MDTNHRKILKVSFITSKEHIEQLKQDFEDVKNDYSLPCEIDPDFIETKTFRSPDAPGIAYYEDFQIQNGIPEIEIPPRYFQLSEQKFTLLHEMIHVCQRSGSLKNLNKDYLVNLIHRLEKIQNSISDTDAELFSIDPKLQMIYMYSTWIFEIWDEMYLKTHYPTLYEKKLDQTHDLISGLIDADLVHFGNWKKYVSLFEFVRVKYLQKITSGTNVESKFKKLCDEWESKLKSFVDDNEFQRLMSKVDDLTNIDAYYSNDPTPLKEVYEDMIQEMLEYIEK